MLKLPCISNKSLSVLFIRNSFKGNVSPKHLGNLRNKGYGAKHYGTLNKHSRFIPDTEKLPTFLVPPNWQNTPLQPYVGFTTPHVTAAAPEPLPEDDEITDWLLELNPPYKFGSNALYGKAVKYHKIRKRQARSTSTTPSSKKNTPSAGSL